MMPRVLLVLAIGLATLVGSVYAEKPASEKNDDTVLDLGSRRELFVDHFLIDRMEGTRLALNRPKDEGIVLKFDVAKAQVTSSGCPASPR